MREYESTNNKEFTTGFLKESKYPDSSKNYYYEDAFTFSYKNGTQDASESSARILPGTYDFTATPNFALGENEPKLSDPLFYYPSEEMDPLTATLTVTKRTTSINVSSKDHPYDEQTIQVASSSTLTDGDIYGAVTNIIEGDSYAEVKYYIEYVFPSDVACITSYTLGSQFNGHGIGIYEFINDPVNKELILTLTSREAVVGTHLEDNECIFIDSSYLDINNDYHIENYGLIDLDYLMSNGYKIYLPIEFIQDDEEHTKYTQIGTYSVVVMKPEDDLYKGYRTTVEVEITQAQVTIMLIGDTGHTGVDYWVYIPSDGSAPTLRLYNGGVVELNNKLLDWTKGKLFYEVDGYNGEAITNSLNIVITWYEYDSEAENFVEIGTNEVPFKAGTYRLGVQYVAGENDIYASSIEKTVDFKIAQLDADSQYSIQFTIDSLEIDGFTNEQYGSHKVYDGATVAFSDLDIKYHFEDSQFGGETRDIPFADDSFTDIESVTFYSIQPTVEHSEVPADLVNAGHYYIQFNYKTGEGNNMSTLTTHGIIGYDIEITPRPIELVAKYQNNGSFVTISIEDEELENGHSVLDEIADKNYTFEVEDDEWNSYGRFEKAPNENGFIFRPSRATYNNTIKVVFATYDDSLTNYSFEDSYITLKETVAVNLLATTRTTNYGNTNDIVLVRSQTGLEGNGAISVFYYYFNIRQESEVGGETVYNDFSVDVESLHTTNTMFTGIKHYTYSNNVYTYTNSGINESVISSLIATFPLNTAHEPGDAEETNIRRFSFSYIPMDKIEIKVYVDYYGQTTDTQDLTGVYIYEDEFEYDKFPVSRFVTLTDRDMYVEGSTSKTNGWFTIDGFKYNNGELELAKYDETTTFEDLSDAAVEGIITLYAYERPDLGLGDVNGDREVTVNDIALYRKALVGGYNVALVTLDDAIKYLDEDNSSTLLYYSSGYSFFVLFSADLDYDSTNERLGNGYYDVRDISTISMALAGGFGYEVSTEVYGFGSVNENESVRIKPVDPTAIYNSTTTQEFSMMLQTPAGSKTNLKLGEDVAASTSSGPCKDIPSNIDNLVVIPFGFTADIILDLNNHVITKGESIPQSDIYIDGNRLGEINGAVLRDRKIMASDGILVVIANIDMKEKKLLIHPNITTRGFILINENEELLKKIEMQAEQIILNKLKEQTLSFNDIKNDLTAQLFPYIYELTGRKPIILPVILDIKREKQDN